MPLKVKPLRSKKYLQAVRELPCCICWQDSVAHHIVGHGYSKMGGKAGDDMTMPLCHTHHMELHSKGYYEFEEKYGMTQLEMIELTQQKLSELLKELRE